MRRSKIYLIEEESRMGPETDMGSVISGAKLINKT